MTTSHDRRVGLYLDQMVNRLLWWGRLVLGALGVVVAGYWYLQVLRVDDYRRLAEHNRLRESPIKAPRGAVEDSAGRLLVENVPSYNLLFDSRRTSEVPESLVFASNILARDAGQLEATWKRGLEEDRFGPVTVAEDLDLSQVARFESRVLEHPEFAVEALQRRLYRHGSQTAHLLGYLGEPNAEDLERLGPNEQSGALVGKDGIELSYDSRLRGVDGREVLVVDSRGRIIEQLRRSPALPGERLHLTLDLELQQEAEHQLHGQVGAIVALDPRDGAVRALVSAPSFDPNAFVKRLQPEEWKRIVSAPHHPLQNRTIHNAYSPGSVFKIVLAIAGLSESVIDPEERVFCAGSKKFFNRQRRCWKRGGHGSVNLHEAIKQSCDIYFYAKGLDVGIETIARYARLLGYGKPTGIDLAGERAGLVPDSKWSEERRGTPWYGGETISVAIGQGPLLATPLQVANVMASVANGGFRVVPHLVEGAGAEPVSLGLDPKSLNRVRRALRDVVDGGSGVRANVAGLEVAGKTGTAQVIEQKTWMRSEEMRPEQRDHAWFASYAPAPAPELVIVVFVEHGGLGSRTAAPIAKALYETYFHLRKRAG